VGCAYVRIEISREQVIAVVENGAENICCLKNCLIDYWIEDYRYCTFLL